MDAVPARDDGWHHAVRGSQRLRLDVSASVLASACRASGTVRLLDVGCGQGDLTKRLDAAPIAMEYVGVDIALNALIRAKHQSPRHGYVEGALPALPFADSTFDVACALEVLYYLDANEMSEALADLARILRPGGRLVISGPVGDAGRYFHF